MQDLSTGEMRDLAPFLQNIPTLANGELKQGRELRDKLQAACDAVQPDRSKQGPVFIVGEVLEIRGGKFVITKIEPGHMRLKGLPL